MNGKGERVAISIDGGTGPVRLRDGRELFYRAGDDLMSVQVKTTPTLAIGERRKLLISLRTTRATTTSSTCPPDGQRFLLIRTETEPRPTRLNVILNWFAELKQRVPANSVRTKAKGPRTTLHRSRNAL